MTTSDERAPEHAPGRLKRLILRGAAIEAVGFGLSNVIRLASNLMLTRLLFPEAFGSLQLVVLLQFILTMLTDVGIMQAVTHSPRGEEPAFLNTAFTLQAIRGTALAAVACLLAWPWAYFYHNDDLLWMIPCAALGQVLNGLTSTRMFVLMRRVQRGPLVFLQLLSQVGAVCATIAAAAAGWGAGSLVLGMVVSPGIQLAVSHFLPGVSHRDRFQLEPEARREITDFGKWIFASSIFTLLIDRSDQLVLGRVMSAGRFGMYGLASLLVEVPGMLNQRVISQVAFPALARIQRDEPQRFAEVFYRVRLWTDAAMQTVLGGMAAMAPWLVGFLWDPRYAEVSWMLQILLARMMATAIILSYEQALMAVGKPRYILLRNLTNVASLALCVPLGYLLGGVPGLLWATVAARAPALVVLWIAAARLGFLRAHRELLPLAFAAAGFALGLGLLQLLPAWTLDELVVEPLKAWWRSR